MDYILFNKIFTLFIKKNQLLFSTLNGMELVFEGGKAASGGGRTDD